MLAGAGHDPLWPTFSPDWLCFRVESNVDRTFDPRPRSRYSCPCSCPTSHYPRLSTSKIEQASPRQDKLFHIFSSSFQGYTMLSLLWPVAAALSRTTFATLLQFAIELLLLRALQWLVGNAITSPSPPPPPLQISFRSPSLRGGRLDIPLSFTWNLNERGRERYSFSLESIDILFHFGLIVNNQG